MISTNPIFDQDDLACINRIVSDGPTGYPSTRALSRAINSFEVASDPPATYRMVSVGADPYYRRENGTNIDIHVRTDHVDAFVRHLMADPEIHTVRVTDEIVFSRPEPVPQPSGLDEELLARLIG